MSNDPFDLSKALEGASKNKLDPQESCFVLETDLLPAGDQKKAIEKLILQLKNNQERCILLGVTGSGKTFAMAQIIEHINIPTLVMSHNKTLARQLHQEFSGLFPNNAVEYFVSHYDYYQPEAYLPQRDLYIDKELSINERIDQERFATVASLVSRPDVLVVSSVSCIYGLNAPETFLKHHCRVFVGQEIEVIDLIKELVNLQYTRSNTDLARGQFRVRGEVLDIWMPSRDDPLRIKFDFEGVESIYLCDSVSWEIYDDLEEAWIHPKEFFMTSPERFERALENIELELKDSIEGFRTIGLDVEAQRIEQRTKYDLEMLREIGHCSGVENYSLHFDGREKGDRPYCLLDFFAACAKQFHGDQDKFLVIMDESHVTLPQVGGMYFGDKSRKLNLIEHGFRLPSAADNRPLTISEFQKLVPNMLYVSATPGERELRHICEITDQKVPRSLMHAKGGGGVNFPELQNKEPDARSMFEILQDIKGIARMEIRPTGLLDPAIEVRGTEGQIQDLMSEINNCINLGERVLVTVLTIKFAEEVSEYLQRMGIKSHYLHSEIDTLERTEIIKHLRHGNIDVIVGINLLREGLDIPEVGLVAIFDADKQGFLRNERSLLQTIGRASRNENGRVLMYADKVSPSMKAAIIQTAERRERQTNHNLENGITPKTIQKPLPILGEDAQDLLSGTVKSSTKGVRRLVGKKGKKSKPGIIEKFKLGAGKFASTSKEMGKNEDTTNDLVSAMDDIRNEMEIAASELEFEKAAYLRDRLKELESLRD
ncbi:MAG: UvrABC system protein B [Methanobacteriota archaeon]|nr:MAG: UvrABC system protein B [Euryarchaeota archaeon]